VTDEAREGERTVHRPVHIRALVAHKVFEVAGGVSELVVIEEKWLLACERP
jgi:hypothetical protein